MEGEFSDMEKRFVLAEAIKKSMISVEKLRSVLAESNVVPDWKHMLLPPGRDLRQCKIAFDSIGLKASSQLPNPQTPQTFLSPEFASSSNKRESMNPMPGLNTKRTKFDTETSTLARGILPKPFYSSAMSITSSPSAGPSQQKKRGRPSKADVERKQREAIERGDIIPSAPVVVLPAGSQGHSRSGLFGPAPPPFRTPQHPQKYVPPTNQLSPQMSIERGLPVSGDSSGNKERPRPPPKPKIQRPGESLFSIIPPVDQLPPNTDAEVKEPGKQKFAESNFGSAKVDNQARGQAFTPGETNRMIRETIKLHSSPQNFIYSIECEVSWEILQYCQQELSGSHDPRKAVTLTGTNIEAQAASCQDYVRMIWKDPGLTLLNAVIRGLSKGTCDADLSASCRFEMRFIKRSKPIELPEKAMITVQGSLDEVVFAVDELAWLAAVLRLPSANGLKQSTIKFWWNNGRYYLFLNPLETEVHSIESPRSETSATCWHPLFRHAVLASGFPIAERIEGDGIEIPFELMTCLARVSVSMDFDKGTILLGDSSLIFPSRLLQSAVQWHYVESNDTRAMIETIKSCHDWVREPDIGRFVTLRTFLGYYTEAQVLLGTETLLRSNSVSRSGLLESKSRIELARQGTTSAGFSVQGILNGTVAAKWTLPKSLRVSLTETRDYDDRLERAVQQPILVYDWGTKSAWLVSELSLVLHMVLTFLRHDRVLQRCQDENGHPLEAWPMLPYADASPDGGKAALRVIRLHRDLYLYTKENRERKLFWNVVDDFLRNMASIRKAVNLRRSEAGWQIFGSRLQGWDFDDLATKETEVHLREVPGSAKKSSWWLLAKEEGMLVVFGCGFGKLITPDLRKIKVIPGWESIPTKSELLAASMPCLAQLSKSCGSDQNPNGEICHLTPEVVWHRPMCRSSSCNIYCNESCIRIQELRSVMPRIRWTRSSTPNPPGNLVNYQAIVFGDPKYYHASLEEAFLSRLPERYVQI